VQHSSHLRREKEAAAASFYETYESDIFATNVTECRQSKMGWDTGLLEDGVWRLCPFLACTNSRQMAYGCAALRASVAWYVALVYLTGTGGVNEHGFSHAQSQLLTIIDFTSFFRAAFDGH